MAKKALSAPEIPLCINVLRLLNYRLAPDELILFDWLTVKQISFKYKPFHYSQARVEEETRIRRTRQEVIIKQFSALGFLKTDIKVNSVTRGRVRYYSVDFSVLADVDVLVEIIRDFVSTKALVDSLAAIRMHTLDTLSNVSDAFKKLETARIKADIINSYICYASYSRMFAEVKNEEEMRAKWNEFNVSLTQDVTPLYKEIVNEDMLNVAVVRDVLSYQEDSTLASLWFKDISIPARTTELYACAKIVDNLRNEASEQTVNEAKAFLQTVKNADFATEIEGKIVQASKLLPGQPAIDFEMLDVEGNVKHLADFKGKVIYIDLWATWCGPCIQESPAFEALGKKYVGKDIVFLPVSTDTTTKPWLRYLDGHKKELTQYHSNDVALKESWAIMYIPRFILIDKDFNIVNAYAPRPSSEEIGTLIDSVLNK